MLKSVELLINLGYSNEDAEDIRYDEKSAESAEEDSSKADE